MSAPSSAWLTVDLRLIASSNDVWSERQWSFANTILLDRASQYDRDLLEKAGEGGHIAHSWSRIGEELFKIRAMGVENDQYQTKADNICSDANKSLEELQEQVEAAICESAGTVRERYEAAVSGHRSINQELVSLCRQRAALERTIYGRIGSAPKPSTTDGDALSKISLGETFVDELIKAQFKNGR